MIIIIGHISQPYSGVEESTVIPIYWIAGKFHGVQLSQISDLLTNRGSNFVDACNCTGTCIYKLVYFIGLIFVVHESTIKIVGPSKISCYTV